MRASREKGNKQAEQKIAENGENGVRAAIKQSERGGGGEEAKVGQVKDRSRVQDSDVCEIVCAQ